MADTLQTYLADRGVHSRPLRRLLTLLSDGPQPLDLLIRTAAVPRRTVEDLLAAAGAQRDGELWSADVDPEQPLPEHDLSPLAGILAGVPAPKRALDHVQADLDTMVRRARWLDETYYLPGAHLVCVGDHDLTALAACTARPELRATVVDLDESLLEYIDTTARARGLNIECLHADFRFGLPELDADLVFTDPPYTPEGMRLFLARSIEALRGPDGRVVVAYGYSTRNPALGLKVQQEVVRLGLVFEAVLPGFNRYLGAQAVGSASDLYVLQPTARAPKLADSGPGIYTHGPQSVESGGTDPAASAALLRLTRGDGVEQPEARRPAWAEPVRATKPVAYDLMADPGPWLARVLLAGPAVRVGALVANNHPDVADQKGQVALRELVDGKYRLTFHRSTPDGKHAVVIAEPVDGGGVRAELLRRAHGKLGNVWREALIRANEGLTKREAKERVAELAPHAEDLGHRLIDLPRHRVAAILAAAG
ncbi:bis-aminopropyl spermidine synthase family protein [Actinokineospora sp. HUAS TT18]|uniref:bis-aminopropyl spermidine synthase family protein n=1 Tax=Actinokineospora sp. HUAS TT18 TaxID=3447451 RepID=UPI003F51E78E